MKKPNKQQKLSPTTVAQNIQKIKVEIKWLKEKEQKIAVKVNNLEGTIRNLQDRCPHPKTQWDDCGEYKYCTTCGAAIGTDSKVIPPERIDYDEELHK
jgi:FtsZ-binding cell division protein ZapB